MDDKKSSAAQSQKPPRGNVCFRPDQDVKGIIDDWTRRTGWTMSYLLNSLVRTKLAEHATALWHKHSLEMKLPAAGGEGRRVVQGPAGGEGRRVVQEEPKR